MPFFFLTAINRTLKKNCHQETGKPNKPGCPALILGLQHPIDGPNISTHAVCTDIGSIISDVIMLLRKFRAVLCTSFLISPPPSGMREQQQTKLPRAQCRRHRLTGSPSILDAVELVRHARRAPEPHESMCSHHVNGSCSSRKTPAQKPLKYIPNESQPKPLSAFISKRLLQLQCRREAGSTVVVLGRHPLTRTP